MIIGSMSLVIYSQDLLSFKGDHLEIMVFQNGGGWLRKKTVLILSSLQMEIMMLAVLILS